MYIRTYYVTFFREYEQNNIKISIESKDVFTDYGEAIKEAYELAFFTSKLEDYPVWATVEYNGRVSVFHGQERIVSYEIGSKVNPFKKMIGFLVGGTND